MAATQAQGQNEPPVILTKREYHEMKTDIVAIQGTLIELQVAIGVLTATIEANASARRDSNKFAMWLIGAVMTAGMMLTMIMSLGISVFIAGRGGI